MENNNEKMPEIEVKSGNSEDEEILEVELVEVPVQVPVQSANNVNNSYNNLPVDTIVYTPKKKNDKSSIIIGIIVVGIIGIAAFMILGGKFSKANQNINENSYISTETPTEKITAPKLETKDDKYSYNSSSSSGSYNSSSSSYSSYKYFDECYGLPKPNYVIDGIYATYDVTGTGKGYWYKAYEAAPLAEYLVRLDDYGFTYSKSTLSQDEFLSYYIKEDGKIIGYILIGSLKGTFYMNIAFMGYDY